MTTASSKMLEKLAAGLGVMLASLFDPLPAAERAPESPVARRADQPSETPSRR